MNPPASESDRPAGTPRCSECHAGLAPDQRYCLGCGARRGELPAPIAAIIGEIRERGRAESAVASRPAGLGPPDGDLRQRLLPPVRAVAFAVLAILGFGVIVGFVTRPPGVERLASTIVVSVNPVTHRVTATRTPSAGSSNSGGGTSSGSSASAAPAAAQAPAQQQTITVNQGTTTPAGTSPTSTSPSNSLLGLPPIKHVFVIMLSGQGYNQSFGTSAGHPYLSSTLTKQGELISDYYAVAGSPLANEIALVSGQGPTDQTLADCPDYRDVSPATTSSHYDEVLGDGCVYPAGSLTLADQLSSAGDRWKAYVEGMQDAPEGQPKSCRHPALNAADPDQAVAANDPYVTWRNPFVYFGSEILGNQCASDDVGLNRLAHDLERTSTTPAFSYIAPSPCDDGSDQPCQAGAPAGLAAAEPFLKKVVPEIKSSPAYKKDGMIAITFDAAPQTGPFADQTSCCDQPLFPNVKSGSSTSTTTSTASTSTTTPAAPSTTTSATTSTTPSTTTLTTAPTTSSTTTTSMTSSTSASPSLDAGTNPGGGQVGLLILSRYVKPGTVDAVNQFNHFSLLRTIEDLFGLKHLGYAKDPALPELDAAIFPASRK